MPASFYRVVSMVFVLIGIIAMSLGARPEGVYLCCIFSLLAQIQADIRKYGTGGEK